MQIVYQEVVENTRLPAGCNTVAHYFCVEISNVHQYASQLIESIANTSWISSLNPIARLSYEETALRTIARLVQIFATVQNTATKEFGEYMVSMSAGSCLKNGLNATVFPISELWKEKILGNHGFDFHSENVNSIVNFGEAKYNSNQSSYTDAANQIIEFEGLGKDRSDAVHLQHFISPSAMSNFQQGRRGFCMAFSLHTCDYSGALDRILATEQVKELLNKCEELVIVGVKV